MSNHRRSVPSIAPAPPAAQAFSRASSILAEKPAHPVRAKELAPVDDENAPKPIRRTFVAKAREITKLTAELVNLMEIGTPLDEIDKLARELAMKCLHVQQETLKARADGAR